MQTFRKSWRTFLPLLTLALVSAAAQAQDPPQPPNASDPIFKVNSPEGELKIIENFAKIIELPARISTVLGFDQEVISVHSVERNPFQIRVFGMTPGITSLVIVDEGNKTYTLEVFVAGDVRHLQAYIDRLFPDSSVKAVAVRDSVVLRGWVARPENITEIVEIAEQFYPNVLNQMQVGGVQQVLLRVRVAEVQRAKIRQLGLNFLYISENGFIGSTPGQLVPLSAIELPFGGPPGVTVNANRLVDSTITGGFTNDDNIFQGFLEALKEESLLKILAEPALVTTNGRPAAMLSGGEFPILVPQSLGTTTIEWREFGVRLEAVPIILGGGRVRLNLQPEVSERDFSNAVTTNGLTVPGLTTRRVNTEVEMRFGQTFILAGLLSFRKTAETSKVPFLGELPHIGAAFRRVRYDEGETELVIMVTPELVSPIGPCELPPGSPGLFTDDPTDRELFCSGMLEVPSYGDRCDGCDTILPYPTLSYGFNPGYHAYPGGDVQAPQPADGFPPTMTVPAPAPSNGNAAPGLPAVPPDAAEGAETGDQTSADGFRVKRFFSRLAGNARGSDGETARSQPPIRQRRTRAFNSDGRSNLFDSKAAENPPIRIQIPQAASRVDRPGLIEPKQGLIQPTPGEDEMFPLLSP